MSNETFIENKNIDVLSDANVEKLSHCQISKIDGVSKINLIEHCSIDTIENKCDQPLVVEKILYSDVGKIKGNVRVGAISSSVVNVVSGEVANGEEHKLIIWQTLNGTMLDCVNNATVKIVGECTRIVEAMNSNMWAVTGDACISSAYKCRILYAGCNAVLKLFESKIKTISDHAIADLVECKVVLMMGSAHVFSNKALTAHIEDNAKVFVIPKTDLKCVQRGTYHLTGSKDPISNLLTTKNGDIKLYKFVRDDYKEYSDDLLNNHNAYLVYQPKSIVNNKKTVAYSRPEIAVGKAIVGPLYFNPYFRIVEIQTCKNNISSCDWGSFFVSGEVKVCKEVDMNKLCNRL